MTRDEILARLAERQPELRARGVVPAAPFGSRARGHNGAESGTGMTETPNQPPQS